jgi:hypothetical protein
MIQLFAALRAPLLCSALLVLPGLSAAQDANAGPVSCKDGTSSPHGGRGACSQHGGIDLAATAAAAQGTANTPPSTQREPMPGGSTGKVWVNTASKVYYCPSDAHYGKTGQGEYMTESDARVKGNHADRNKPCS